LNYAYVLINNGRKDAAIPYAKNYAQTRGGEWKKMYAQLTQKPGAPGAPAVKLSREQLIAMAQSKTISAANKRQIAFQLLNDGDKPDATAIFAQLAQDKGPDSQEVKDLMYMWGGKLNAQQLGWLEQRAATASPYDKNKWSDLINNSADDNAVLHYVSATPEALYNRNLRKRYFRIIAETGSRQNYDVAMRGWVAQTTDVPALSDYAATAQAYGYRTAAISGYKRVLALDPNNAVALNQSAALDFGRGQYKEADQDLNHYLAATAQSPDPESNPAQAHFYKAELLRRQGNNAAAQVEYNQVVRATDPNSTAPDALSRLYTSEFRLGQTEQAKAGFEQLLAAHPDDKGILADYMSALIEHHMLADATRIANQYDKTSPYYGRGAMLEGKSAHVASIERLSDGREMKITFDQPIEDKSPINMKDAQQLAWLEHAELGYDSVSISAKPGYVVRYEPTAQQEFAIVPATAPEYSPQVETQREQELRLQLLYARIEQDSGQTDKAKARLAALQQYYPDNPQLISYEANVESAQGNTYKAQELLEQAQALAPDNEDFTQTLQHSRQVNSAQFVKLDHEYRNYGADNEQITTLSGVARITSNAELGANLMNDFVNTKAVINPANGSIARGAVERQAGEIFLGYYLDSGSRLQVSGFTDEKTGGLGAYYAFDNPLGRTELLAEYHKTYWDYPEAVYDYTTRDRVGFHHYVTLDPRNTLGIEASVNNYNVDVDDSVVQTVLGRLSYVHGFQLQTENQPFLGVGYGFDGEYRTDKPDTMTNPVNGTYRPLEFDTREVHQLTGIYRDDWTPQTHALFDAGWVYDRIGGQNGPVVEGRIDQDITDSVQAGIRGRYSRVSSETDGDAVNLGADIMYKF
jgi:tetratricopeptide (TPR) repeat protein